jgi:hypothetical protein
MGLVMLFACVFVPRFVVQASFCVLLDARRPDLIEDWYAVLRCIKIAELRNGCRVLTWQELAPCLPSALREFLT